MNQIKKIILPRLGIDVLPRQKGDIVTQHRGKVSIISYSADQKGLPPTLTTVSKSENKDNRMTLRLPNIHDLKIELKSYNPLLAAFGLQTRAGSTKIIVQGQNTRANRYLAHMWERLAKAKSNPRLYWKIAFLLISRSHGYLIAALHYKDKNLYRTLPQDRYLSLIDRINGLRGQTAPKRVQKLLYNYRTHGLRETPPIKPSGEMVSEFPDTHVLFDHYMRYRRKYLPKGSTYRPLGVPTIA